LLHTKAWYELIFYSSYLNTNAIAQAGKKPEDGAMQKIAKTALKLLKGALA